MLKKHHTGELHKKVTILHGTRRRKSHFFDSPCIYLKSLAAGKITDQKYLRREKKEQGKYFGEMLPMLLLGNYYSKYK